MPRMDEFYRECQKKLDTNSVLHANGHCIIWTGCVRRQGYVQFRYKYPRDDYSADHKTYTACGIALIIKLKNFDISAESQASHPCNNRLCINTEHLTFASSSISNRRTCFRLGKRIDHIHTDGLPASSLPCGTFSELI